MMKPIVVDSYDKTEKELAVKFIAIAMRDLIDYEKIVLGKEGYTISDDVYDPQWLRMYKDIIELVQDADDIGAI